MIDFLDVLNSPYFVNKFYNDENKTKLKFGKRVKPQPKKIKMKSKTKKGRKQWMKFWKYKKVIFLIY